MPTFRRKLTDGTLLEGVALEAYIPKRGRRGRHYSDTFSQALALAKLLPDVGQQWAWDLAGPLAELVPADAEVIVCPPAGRRRLVQGSYLARELAAAVVEKLREGGKGCLLGRPLRWQQSEIAGAAKASYVMHQAGHGRKLGRVAECLEDLAGKRLCVVDDLWTSGATAAVTAEALYRAGAASVYVVAAGMTERTEHRPQEERELLKLRAAAKRR